jgi:tetratricopeptide (TPR) repeat protein
MLEILFLLIWDILVLLGLNAPPEEEPLDAVPVTVEAPRNACQRKSGTDHFARAEACLEAIRFNTNTETEQAWLYANRCDQFLMADVPKSAVQACTHALALAPGYGWPQYLRGLAHLDLGQWEDALDDFNLALGRFNQPSLILAGRGIAYARLGSDSAALNDFRRALPAINRIGTTYETNRSRVTTMAALERATINIRRHNNAEAATELEAIVLVWPNWVPALLTFASLRVQEGDTRSAEHLIDRAVTVAPADMQAVLARARLRLATGRAVAALADFNQAVVLAPSSPETWIARADALSTLGFMALALQNTARAIVLSDSGAEALAARARILERLGYVEFSALDYEQADRAWRR